jgi:hypothetical protein
MADILPSPDSIMADAVTRYSTPVLLPCHFPALLDIFKKDRTAYVQYIYAIIETRQRMANVPHKKAAAGRQAGYKCSV